MRNFIMIFKPFHISRGGDGRKSSTTQEEEANGITTKNKEGRGSSTTPKKALGTSHLSLLVLASSS